MSFGLSACGCSAQGLSLATRYAMWKWASAYVHKEERREKRKERSRHKETSERGARPLCPLRKDPSLRLRSSGPLCTFTIARTIARIDIVEEFEHHLGRTIMKASAVSRPRNPASSPDHVLSDANRKVTICYYDTLQRQPSPG